MSHRSFVVVVVVCAVASVWYVRPFVRPFGKTAGNIRVRLDWFEYFPAVRARGSAPTDEWALEYLVFQQTSYDIVIYHGVVTF